jgi:hypothetical protein
MPAITLVLRVWHVRRLDTGCSLMLRAYDRVEALCTGAELLAARPDQIRIAEVPEWNDR